MKNLSKAELALLMKGITTECNNYRTISILPYASKILLGILKESIKNMEQYVN